MYDELIKQLGQLAEDQMFDFERQPYLQAADAIEELERENERLHDDLGKAIRELAKQPRWIPVTERLPEKDQTVLAYCAEDNFCYISRMHQSFEDYDVTHWIPLPQMPKDGES